MDFLLQYDDDNYMVFHIVIIMITNNRRYSAEFTINNHCRYSDIHEIICHKVRFFWNQMMVHLLLSIS